LSLVDSVACCASALALEDCDTLAIDRDTLQECLRTIPALACNLALMLGCRLRRANLQIQSLIALDLTAASGTARRATQVAPSSG
jgi:CRP-like cAMP-binding protein